jgi:hypothetical protein
MGLGWQNIEIRTPYRRTGWKTRNPTHHHIITLASGSNAERPGRDGRLVPYAKLPGAINVDPEESFQPFIRPLKQS